MGAVRMRVQTADKNFTSNPHHSSPSVNILWSEKLRVCKKHIHQDTSNPWFCPKNKSIIHNPSEKVSLLLIHQHICLALFWTVLSYIFVPWSGANYCGVFISCFDSHSDGTHSLQRIHWWASDVTLLFFFQICSNKQIGWIIPLIYYVSTQTRQLAKTFIITVL